MKELFEIAKLNKLAPSKGKVLISEPFMEDNFFKRSVVFLCEHNEDGSFGFVLNNMLSINIHELMEDIKSEDFRLGFGGPVNSSNLYFIHTLGETIEGAHEILDGIYTGGDFEQLKSLINTGILKENEIRFFLGYSGWTPGQLDQEIKENAWIVSDFDSQQIFSQTDKDVWKNLLDNMGGKFKVIANFPEDPSLN